MASRACPGWIIALLVGGVVVGSGCRLLRPHEPVQASLVTSRQLTRQAWSALAQEQLDQALAFSKQAVETCSADLDARQVYAEALWAKGLRQEALKELQEVIRLAPKDAQVQARMAEMYLALGQIALARQYANQAIELNPQLTEAWVVRARVARVKGDFRSALADYHRALAYVPNHPEILLEVAEVYRATDQPDRALATLHRLADTYPPGEEPPQVLYLQGLAYSALNRPQEAAEVLALAIQRGGPSADWLYQLAQAEAASGRLLRAQQTLHQALALQPDHPPSQQLLNQLESVQPTQALLPR